MGALASLLVSCFTSLYSREACMRFTTAFFSFLILIFLYFVFNHFVFLAGLELASILLSDGITGVNYHSQFAMFPPFHLLVVVTVYLEQGLT